MKDWLMYALFRHTASAARIAGSFFLYTHPAGKTPYLAAMIAACQTVDPRYPGDRNPLLIFAFVVAFSSA